MIWLLLLAGLPALTDQHGNAVELPQGQYVLLDFAASWCAPCHRALPHIETIHQSYSKLKVLVVCVDLEESNWKSIVNRHQLTVPVIWDKQQIWVHHYQPKGMPTTMLLDPQGNVVHQHTGFSQSAISELEAKLNKLALN